MEPEKFMVGRDYYIEKDKIIFTATFLEKRGECCTSSCRHCPWGFKRNKIEKSVDKPPPA